MNPLASVFGKTIPEGSRGLTHLICPLRVHGGSDGWNFGQSGPDLHARQRRRLPLYVQRNLRDAWLGLRGALWLDHQQNPQLRRRHGD